MFHTAPFGWIMSHLHLLGWPTVIYGVYRFVKFLLLVGKAAGDFSQRVLNAEDTLNTIAHNHLAHMQQSLESIDVTQKGLREDIRALMVSKD